MPWETIRLIAYTIVFMLSASITALWVSLVIWAFRDMRSRSHDIFAQILAALIVLLLGPFGLLLHLILRPKETLAEAYERALEEEALLQDIEERAVCPGCKQPAHDDWVVCPYCHTQLRTPCPHCNRLLDLNWTICPYCGRSPVTYSPKTSLDQEATPQPQAEPETLSE